MFDWEDLRYFVTFAQTGSLASAARRLGVDHATVARRISSLEISINLKLVDRRPRSYVLTEDGCQVARHGEKISASAYALERFAGAEQNGVEGDVIVAAPPAFLGSLIAPHVGRFYSQFPGLRLHLLVTKENLSLTRREADIAINLTRPAESALVARRLGSVRFTLCGSAEYLKSGQELTFIAYDETVADTPQQEWLKKHAAGRPVMFFSNDLRVQAITAAGHAGIALLPDYLAREYHVLPVDPARPALIQDIWLSVHEDVRHTKRINTVVDFIVSCIEPVYSL